MYRSLCKRWNPDITEQEVVKLTLKNINPTMASQLRGSRVTTVEALVRLGQQLEKDRENQRHYEQRKKSMQKPARSEGAAQPHPPLLQFTVGVVKMIMPHQPAHSISLVKTSFQSKHPYRQIKIKEVIPSPILLYQEVITLPLHLTHSLTLVRTPFSPHLPHPFPDSL